MPISDHRPIEPLPKARSVAKRRAILDAATRLFLAEGFAGASMDAIAAAAGVSKPTVYKHFADKQRLFAQMVGDMIEGFARPFYDRVINSDEGGDVEEHLRELAMLLLSAVMQTPNLQLRRLVIGEAARFPELGRAYERHGPDRAIAALAKAFEQLEEEGKLRLEDPSLAAAHFNWLVVSIPLNHAMLSGDDRPPASHELRTYAEGAVQAFVAAYG